MHLDTFLLDVFQQNVAYQDFNTCPLRQVSACDHTETDKALSKCEIKIRK